MTIREASKQLGISSSTLYQLVATRKIGCYRIGSKILFDPEDIAGFKASCRVSSTTASNTPPSMPRLKLKHISLSRGTS
jgi:excisionase family DNA binding protein